MICIDLSQVEARIDLAPASKVPLVILGCGPEEGQATGLKEGVHLVGPVGGFNDARLEGGGLSLDRGGKLGSHTDRKVALNETLDDATSLVEAGNLNLAGGLKLGTLGCPSVGGEEVSTEEARGLEDHGSPFKDGAHLGLGVGNDASASLALHDPLAVATGRGEGHASVGGDVGSTGGAVVGVEV